MGIICRDMDAGREVLFIDSLPQTQKSSDRLRAGLVWRSAFLAMCLLTVVTELSLWSRSPQISFGEI